MSNNKLIIARKEFQLQVEKVAAKSGSYLDAIYTVCDNNGIEVEAVSWYVTGALKDKVTQEAKKKFLLRRELCKEEIVEIPMD